MKLEIITAQGRAEKTRALLERDVPNAGQEAIGHLADNELTMRLSRIAVRPVDTYRHGMDFAAPFHTLIIREIDSNFLRTILENSELADSIVTIEEYLDGFKIRWNNQIPFKGSDKQRAEELNNRVRELLGKSQLREHQQN